MSPPGASGPLASNFQITSSVGGTNLPFALGYAFRQGDVPSGQIATTADASSWQCTPKNYWPDGSLKFALLAGRKTLTAGIAATITLSAASPSGGTALAISDLKATGVTASIGFGASAVSWATTDWDSPAQTLTSGPVMSSWTYRKPIGSDAHLVGWLEVRLFAGGQVQVLPWIENGYLSVASPSNKTGRATFTLNGSLKYDSINDDNYTGPYDSFVVVNAGTVNLAAQCRMCLVSGTQIAHWTGTDPQITPSHNVAYLVATKVVPAYRPTSINETDIVNWCVTQGNYSPMRTRLTEGMGGTGYSHDIGLLPMNSAIYLVTGDTRAYKAVLNWGYSLGSHAIHYRDQATNRPLLFASFPNKSTNTGSDLTPTPTGGEPYRYATSHHPAAAYLPYLISGWNWFVEEIQFQVTLHYLAMPPGSRQNANCFFHPSAGHYGGNNQGGPRAIGWQWRTMAMCASITPDADSTMRAQFVTALGYNATSYRQIHETGTWAGGLAWAPNDLGLCWEPGFPAGVDAGKLVGATWQDDFVTMSVGLSWDLEVITDATKKADLLWFRDFKYKAIVGRLGEQNRSDVWNYRVAAPYNIYLGIPGGGGTTMDWYDTWGQAYSENFPAVGSIGHSLSETNTGQSGNDLLNGNIGGNGMSTSYFGNLQPAIAYAVDHNAFGALAAYERMVAASNYATTITEFNSIPIWGIKPRWALPSWAASLPVMQWTSVGTSLQSVQPNPLPPTPNNPVMKLYAWNGIACNRSLSRLYAQGGGHGDYCGNEVDTIDLAVDSPAWVQRCPPTYGSSNIYNDPAAYFADYRPSPTHTYYSFVHSHKVGCAFVMTTRGMNAGGLPAPPGNWPYVNNAELNPAFSDAAGDWEKANVHLFDNYPIQAGGDWTAQTVMVHQITGDVYFNRPNHFTYYKFDPSKAAGTQWTLLSSGQGNTQGYAGAAIDPIRQRILIVGNFGSDRDPQIRNLSNYATQSVSFTGLGASALRCKEPSVVYDEYLDCFWVVRLDGSAVRLLKVDAETLDVTEPATTGTTPIAPDNGIQSKANYVPALKGIAFVNRYDQQVKFLRTA